MAYKKQGLTSSSSDMGKWSIPPMHKPDSDKPKAGGSSGQGGKANKHANTPSGGKDIVSSFKARY